MTNINNINTTYEKETKNYTHILTRPRLLCSNLIYSSYLLGGYVPFFKFKFKVLYSLKVKHDIRGNIRYKVAVKTVAVIP